MSQGAQRVLMSPSSFVAKNYVMSYCEYFHINLFLVACLKGPSVSWCPIGSVLTRRDRRMRSWRLIRLISDLQKPWGRQYYFRPVVSTAETRNELKGKSGEEAEIMDGYMLRGEGCMSASYN